MPAIRAAAIALFFTAASGPAAAVTVYQCEDDRGNRTFESACPPGTTEVGTRDYSGTVAPADAGTEPGAPPEITLYLVPECEACTQVREFLDLRELSYTTRDVGSDAVLQQELKKRAGELRAPTVLVGDRAVVGYNRTALIAALQEAGHIDAEEETPAGTETAPAPTEPAPTP